jgi:hypothetical protein
VRRLNSAQVFVNVLKHISVLVFFSSQIKCLDNITEDVSSASLSETSWTHHIVRVRQNVAKGITNPLTLADCRFGDAAVDAWRVTALAASALTPSPRLAICSAQKESEPINYSLSSTNNVRRSARRPSLPDVHLIP